MYGKAMLAVFVFAGTGLAAEVSLSTDLMPIFARSCAVCHQREGGNEKAIKDKTFYEKKEDIMGVVGTYILPGKPEQSGLLKILNQTTKVGRRETPMPPPKSDVPKWSEAELKLFSEWVSAGAKDN